MRIAVLSRLPDVYGNRRLIEAGLQRGCDIAVVDPLAVLSGGPWSSVSGSGLAADFDAVIPRFSPYWQDQGTAVLQRWQSLGIVSLNSAAAISLARDMPQSVALFRANGIACPVSVCMDNLTGVSARLGSMFDFPLLIKLQGGMQGSGVEKVDDIDRALVRIAELHRTGKPFLVQEFIAEAQGVDRRLLVLNNEVIAGMTRRAAKGDFRANTHLGGTAEAYCPDAEEIGMALSAARLLGLDVAGVDIIPSRRGPLLLEVNACPGFEHLERVSGVDVAGKLLDLLMTRFKRKKYVRE
jgi:ribosomal protein S6--L-glutamate ligase